MLRAFVAILLLALAYGAYHFVSRPTEKPVVDANAPALGTTPREVYCKLPTARLPGGEAQLHVDYDECMRTSALPLLAAFPPEQQEIYKRTGIVGR